MAASDKETDGRTRAARLAWDATSRYLDASALASRSAYANAASAFRGGHAAAFDLQDATIQAFQALLTVAIEGGVFWFQQTAEAMLRGQAAALEVLAAGLEMRDTPSDQQDS